MNLLSGRFLTTLLLAFTLGLVGCSSGSKSSGSGASMGDGESMEGANLEINGDSDGMNAGGLRTVNFEFDSSRISSSAKAILEANAEFLKENPSLQVQIEGHCDERGSVEYNLALGERRAKSVRDYLSALGVSSSRLSTVSFGKERPLDYSHNESAWGKNRRANFVVIAK